MLVLGCSSKAADTPATEDASISCPNTVDLAVGAACTLKGQDCPIGYPCGPFNQQAHCICDGKTYACTDAKGTALDKGTEPECVDPGKANDAQCPATEADALAEKTNSCKTAGLLCFYTGASCPENTQPFTDSCQCLITNDGTLRFTCEQKTCNPHSDASGIPDVGQPDTKPPADAGSDG
jgi:hypothetical protein